MPAHVFPRRTTSTATTLTVSAAPTTALQAAAQTVGFDSNEFLAFAGQTNITAQYGLSYEQPHPTSGISCDLTEDGATSAAHTAIDWAAKGWYDPTSKRVLWASCGAGQKFAGGYVYNTMPFYDETLNRWTVSRGFRGANETASAEPIVHLYDGMALDIVGRRFYRKKLDPRVVMVYDLANNVWLNNFTYSGGEPTSYGGDVGMDWHPGTGRLWVRAIQNGTDNPIVFEVNPSTGAVRTIAVGAALGGSNSPSVCVYNPRAFGGAGGFFVGGSNAAIIRADTEAVTSASAGKPAGNFLWPYGAHVCRDPVGDGWIHASTDGFMYRLTSAGVWTQRAQQPLNLRTDSGTRPYVMVPIDEYGVIWIIGSDYGGDRAWLYKP